MAESEGDKSLSDHSDEDDPEEEDISWIQWFCSLKGNEFFCEVAEDYIQDDFNLTGLSSQVPYYDYAMDTILDIEIPANESLSEEQLDMIESASELLYGLIHARFILTSRGMAAMVEKFQHVDFGRCPRVYCQGQPCLPVGQSDIPRQRTVKIFCPVRSPVLSAHYCCPNPSDFPRRAPRPPVWPALLLQQTSRLLPVVSSASLSHSVLVGCRCHRNAVISISRSRLDT